eukprot:CAMPEP_0203907370 /NCGR_PEP_ID=MMETSP0359-20131031/48893_1 /ASSEMBLY_ACC=CAM_ASM_000338 /TAXON_ID=268821 /ORGANISM="Scrippsiella Hangoei, Strain SHTV-5" /LENGTH=62 /DNA_ID=CAMNT_0050832175 /DNA_START=39 /DNA_END=223 /DNA_ORIENTATION=+
MDSGFRRTASSTSSRSAFNGSAAHSKALPSCHTASRTSSRSAFSDSAAHSKAPASCRTASRT